MDFFNKIYKGDCLQVMETLPDGSIDLILCDLPYGTTECIWDVVIPFDTLWKHYKRLIKENGAILLFGSQPFTTDLINSNRDWFRYEIIWEKTRPSNFFLANKQPLKAHENICVFYKMQPTYNVIKWKGNNNHASKPRLSNSNIHNLTGIKNGVDTNEDKFPKSVINVKSTDSTKNLHPTQKPEKLLEWLILLYSNENEIILDNTMGSGSTVIACVKTKRKFIGIEKDEKYFEIAEKRINNELSQPKLF